MQYWLFNLAVLVLAAPPVEHIPLSEAIQRGLVQVEVRGLGGHMGKAVEFRLEPRSKKKLGLQIPAGLILHSQDSTEQDLILAQGRLLSLEGQPRTFTLAAYCIQASNRSPAKGAIFQVGSLATGHLLTLAQHLHHARIEDARGQEAVWVLSDRHPLTYVTDYGLQQFLARILGKEAPGYWIRHQQQGGAGQPAFQSAPAQIEGFFNFKTEEPQVATLGLYSQDEQLLLPLHDFGTLKPGGHRLRFEVALRNLAPGSYSVQLRDAEEQVLESMAVEF